MSLPYCPNCRHTLPSKLESWTCLELKLIAAPEERGNVADLGAADFDDNAEVDDMPYQDEHQICNTFNKSGEVCSRCERPKTKGLYEIVCPNPNCRMEIPMIPNCDPRTITVTGPSGAGKSHYIVALNTWWSQLQHFNLVVVPAMGDRIKKEFKRFVNQVERNKQQLPPTLAGKMISFSWQIKTRDNSRPGLLFTLPDVSGERVMDSRALLANRYYHHTSGTIFLLDADRLIQADNPSATTGPQRDSADHFEVADAMIKDLQRRLEPAQVSNMPIAICVNKLDKLRAHNPRWDELARRHIPFHNGYFDMQNCSLRSEEIRRLLWADHELAQALGLLEATFDNVMYFIIATIGSDSETVKLMPVAVEDPFLYLLWHLGYVETNGYAVA